MHPPSCTQMPMVRRSKQPRHSAASKPDDARSRYFDYVPVDSLRIVLRYLSNRLQNQDWHTSISPSTVKTVLDVGGGLERAAQSEFQSIGGKDGVPLETVVDASILRPIVHRLRLRRLVFGLGGGEMLWNFLRGCGAELKELILTAEWCPTTETDILAITTHCTQLSSLAIRGSQVESPLKPIWRSLGSALTQVYLGCYYSTSGYGLMDIISASDLVECCVNLRRVDVKELQDGIADVLVALGSRIRALSFRNELRPSIEQARKVYRACSNLEAVHLVLYNYSVGIDVLSLMSAKLVSLKLHDLRGRPNPDESDDSDDPGSPNNLPPAENSVFSVLSACSALRKVELDVSIEPLQVLRKLLESLKSVTTMAWDMSSFSAELCKAVIDVIACNLRNLEAFTISTDNPLRGGDVAAIVALPRLKSVTFRHWFCGKWDSDPVEKCAVEVVRKFRDCSHLVQLEIVDFAIFDRYRSWNWSQRIADAAALYDRKDFDMFIGGVQYRTW